MGLDDTVGIIHLTYLLFHLEGVKVFIASSIITQASQQLYS